MQSCRFPVLTWPIIFLVIFTACNETGKPGTDNPASENSPWEMRIRHQLEKHWQQEPANQGFVYDSIDLECYDLLQFVYKGSGNTAVWSDSGTWQPAAAGMIHYLENLQESGLFKEKYHYPAISHIKNLLEKDSVKRLDAKLWADADLVFTDAFMMLLQDLGQGRLQPDSLGWRNDTGKYRNFFEANLARIKKGESPDSIFRSAEPAHPGYLAIKSKLKGFTDSMDTRVYTYLDYPYKKADIDDSMHFVKQLLIRLKESSIVDKTDGFDSASLADAIKKYQVRRKLAADGKITSSLIKNLNNTDINKYLRIAVTLDRYKQLPRTMPEDYIFVNLPGFYLQVWESDTIAFTSRIICGKPETATPLLTSKINHLVIYPTWTVPASIIKKEMLPALKRNAGYLRKKGLNLYDKDGEPVDPFAVNWEKYSKGIPYKIQQGSGDGNALGVIKFNFENPFAVYLHDTNQRYLFSKQMRALSHGCVRVQEWEKLAFFIAGKDSMQLKSGDTLRYNRDSISNWIANKQKQHISVRYQIPLFIRYFGCEVVDGNLKFYDDIYGEDRKAIEDYFLPGKYSFNKGNEM